MILDPREEGYLSHIFMMIVDARGAFCKPEEMYKLTQFQFQVNGVINMIYNEIQTELTGKKQ